MLNIDAKAIVAKRKAVIARLADEIRADNALPESERMQRHNQKVERTVQEICDGLPARLDAAAELGVTCVVAYRLDPGLVWGYTYCPERLLEETTREFQRDVLSALHKRLHDQPGIICWFNESGGMPFGGRELMVAAKVTP